jgi:hypothetical protein
MTGGAMMASATHATHDFIFGGQAKTETHKGDRWKTAVANRARPFPVV